MSQNFTVTALLAARNEEDIVARAVEHLIAQGARVYLIDHGSTDETIGRVEPLLGQGIVAIERFPEESPFSPKKVAEAPWESILRRKEQLAGKLDSDWFIHQDADEFRESPWEGMTLVEAIRRIDELGYNAIDFEVLEFPPIGRSWSEEADLEEAFPCWHPPAGGSRHQIRCWKADMEVDLVSSGGCEAAFPGRRVLPVRFPMRHYPIRSQAHGERKLVERRALLAPEMETGWHRQWEDLGEDHVFVRDADTLTPYDLDAMRRHLVEHHREARSDADRAVEVPRDREVAQLQRELENRGREAAAQRRRLIELEGLAREAEQAKERLSRELEQLERKQRALREQGAELSANLEARDVELLTLGAERGDLSRRVDDRDADLVDLETRYRELEKQLTDRNRELEQERAKKREAEDSGRRLRESWSWRVTRPFRSLDRRLRAH